MATETTQTIVREAPDIEAYKIGLLQSAKNLANQSVGMKVPATDAQGNPVLDAQGNPTFAQETYLDAEGVEQSRDVRQLPRQEVAGQDALQTQAYDLAKEGVGAYKPYVEGAGYTMGDSVAALGGKFNEETGQMEGGIMQDAQPFQRDANTLMAGAATNAAAQVGAGQTGIANAMSRGIADTGKGQAGLAEAALGARTMANQGMTDQLAAYDAIPGQIAPAQEAMSQSGVMAQDVAKASREGATNVTQGLAEQLASATKGSQQAAATGAQEVLTSARAAEGLTDLAADQSRQQAATAQQGLADASAGGLGAYADAMKGVNQVSQAAQSIQDQTRTGSLGAAQQGISQLADTTQAYDPASAGAYMNEYEDAAVQQALKDVQRAGDIQQQGNRANAVGAGAFGGSRSGIMETETARNTLEQQARTAAQMRQQGFESAATRSQQGFEQQQARAQTAAQATGQLGLSAEELSSKVGMQSQGMQQQGALAGGQMGLSANQQAGANAAQAGQMGMSAEQMAQQGAIQAGQLGVSAGQAAGQMGMSAQAQAAQNAQAVAQQGMSTEQLAAQTGLSAAATTGQMAQQAGQLGLAGAQTQAEISNRAAQQGIGAEQLAGQLAGQYGQMGQGLAAQGIGASQTSANLGLQGAELSGRMGEGIGNLGAQYGQLGTQVAAAQGDAALRQASLGAEQQRLQQSEQGFLFDVGKTQQAQTQAEMEAKRASDTAQLYEPYQRVGFLSDIYKGAPSSQSSITISTAPGVSSAQSMLGLGIAGLSAAGGASKAGLFG